MTEADWEAGKSLRAMIEYLQGKASARKLRLFAAACCRRVWGLLTDERSRYAVETAARYADGAASYTRLTEACRAAEAARYELRRAARSLGARAVPPAASLSPEAAAYAAAAAHAVALGTIADAVESLLAAVPEEDRPAERAADLALLRDVIGNPFRPARLDRAWVTWNDGTAKKLAQQVYDSRDFSLLPILCDALEEAGCGDEQIIKHCRLPGEHTRGCWVVDLLLGRE
ncbi:MAG TPA: hypothetical protein VFA26_09510 [Gemmataceae bacterium]|nr:hypothetical protein [Gemmataceae bacterium]